MLTLCSNPLNQARFVCSICTWTPMLSQPRVFSDMTSHTNRHKHVLVCKDRPTHDSPDVLMKEVVVFLECSYPHGKNFKHTTTDNTAGRTFQELRVAAKTQWLHFFTITYLCLTKPVPHGNTNAHDNGKSLSLLLQIAGQRMSLVKWCILISLYCKVNDKHKNILPQGGVRYEKFAFSRAA